VRGSGSRSRAERLRRESQGLEVDQEIAYHPAPSKSSIERLATLEEWLRPQGRRITTAEFVLTRPGANGGAVVQGALFQEVLTYANGARVVRDTWRLFPNYVFPNASTPISVMALPNGGSQDVRAFLLRHEAAGG
jgi:hypothetical protein